MKTIDADRHVIEPIEMWYDYVPTEYYSFIPYLQENSNGIPFYMIDGKPLMNKWNENDKLQKVIVKEKGSVKGALKQATAPKYQLESMDSASIDRAYIFPTYSPYIIGNEQIPSEVSVAFANGYNTWLKEYCDYNVSRLHGVGFISRHDPSTMENQLQQVVLNKWNAIVLRPEKICGRSLGHVDYTPFWQACDENNIAVVFHGGTHLHAPTAGADRFDSHFGMHACAHPHEIQMAFLSLLESGVFERHPTLKFAFLEGGASWLPSWLWRLDEICYGSLKEEVTHNITMKPTEYFKRQCWIGFEPDEPCLRQVIDWVGADRLLFGSDFPHPDHLDFTFDALQGKSTVFTEEEVELILSKNPELFFEGSIESKKE